MTPIDHAGQMTAARWERVKEYFDLLQGEPPARRSSMLLQWGDDPSLVGELESLLSAHDDTGPLDAMALSLLGRDLTTLEGQRVGPYRLEREIGSGGMGTVYVASRVDDEYSKRVAIKFMARSFLGDATRQRFRRERQIMARLDHPGIARLLDGGTTSDGTPFIIMEYVDGSRIDTWCSERSLPAEERIRLFLRICDAVRYAHRHLIVHRDLKPANILVTKDGDPKLLDFGIAKLLDTSFDCAWNTDAGERALTPAYASPEQMLGHPVSTASDVYALGVLLYELLAGRRPYDIPPQLTPEVVRIVCEFEPPRPSAVAAGQGQGSALRGDLDRIILKAIAKEPVSRYQSVDEFADDLMRYLGGLPVLAREPTLRYRLGKYIRRNRTGVAAAVMVMTTLVATSAYSMRQASIAVQERRRAEEQAAIATRRFDDVRTLSNTMLFELHDALRPLPGALHLRQSLVSRSLTYLDSLAQEVRTDPKLMSDVGMAYQKLGSITYGVEATRSSHERAVAIHEKLIREHPGNATFHERLALNLSSLANALKLSGDRSRELASYQRSLALMSSLPPALRRSIEYRHEVRDLHDVIGVSLAAQGQFAEARVSSQRGLSLARALMLEHPADIAAARGVIHSLHRAGTIALASGQLDVAVQHYSEAMAIVQPLASASPSHNELRRDLWLVHRNLGTSLSRQGRHDTGVRHLREALTLKEALLAADPTDGGHRRGLAITLLDLGDALMRAGDVRGARTMVLRSLAAGEPLLSDDPENQETWDDVRAGFASLREASVKLHGHGVEDAIRRERALYARIAAAHPGNLKAQEALSSIASRR